MGVRYEEVSKHTAAAVYSCDSVFIRSKTVKPVCLRAADEFAPNLVLNH